MYVSYLFFFCFLLLKDFFQCDVWIGFSEHVLLQLELAVLDGRDGDAVDVADGAVADAQAGEDTQADVVFLHVGVLLTKLGEAVVVDGVQRAFHLAPFLRTEIDQRIAALVQLLHGLRTLQNEVLQERHHFVGLMQQGFLVLGLLQQLAFLLTLCPYPVTDRQHESQEDYHRSNDDDKQCACVHL